MGTSFRISIDGDKALEKAINKLPDRIARKALRKAIRAANTIERRAMRKAAPVGKARGKFPGGQLKKSIKSKIKAYPKTNTVVGIVGPEYKMSRTQHLSEEGTAERTHKSGKSVGSVAARHWGRAAHESVKSRANKAMRDKLAKEVEAEANKL